MPNKIKQIWQSGGAAVNGWLAHSQRFRGRNHGASRMGQRHRRSAARRAGLHVHGRLLPKPCRPTPCSPWCACPGMSPGIVGKVLDAGAYGVICPMVKLRRGSPQLRLLLPLPPPPAPVPTAPSAPAIYGVSTSYQKTANEEILCIPMIETQQAVNSLEAILDVPGIDAVYIGPSDLGFSYGLIPVLDPPTNRKSWRSTTRSSAKTAKAGHRRLHPLRQRGLRQARHRHGLQAGHHQQR